MGRPSAQGNGTSSSTLRRHLLPTCCSPAVPPHTLPIALFFPYSLTPHSYPQQQQYGRPPPGYGGQYGGGYPPQRQPYLPPNPDADKPLALQSWLEDKGQDSLFGELQAAGLDTWRKIGSAFPASPTGGAWDGADRAFLQGFIAKCPGFGKPTIAMALLARAAAEAGSGAAAHKTNTVKDALTQLAPAGAADFLFDALASKGYDTYFSLNRAYGVTPGKGGTWADVGDAGVVLSQFVTDVPVFGAPLLAQGALAKAAQMARSPAPGMNGGMPPPGYAGGVPPQGAYPPGAYGGQPGYPPPGSPPPQYGPGRPSAAGGGGMGAAGAGALGAGAGMLGGYMLGSAMAGPHYGGYGGGYGGQQTIINENNVYEPGAGGFDMGQDNGGGGGGFDMGNQGWDNGGGGGAFDLGGGDWGGDGGGFDGGDFGGGGGDW